jgi:CRP/FNR family transcriptional regulator, dissimilatory nitrate respiration regulator
MRPNAEDIAIIGATPLFSGLAAEDMAHILRGASVRQFDEDTLLFSAGDHADRFYVALKGSVRLFALNKDGDEAIIEVVGAGHSFAEAAIFSLGRYPVNAEAMAGARVAAIGAAPLLDTLRGNSVVATGMLSSLCRWQLHLLAEIRRLRGQSPAQRLAWFLLSLTDGSDRTALVHLPYRKSILAGRIGITPESLSRALARLGELGVETKGDEVVLRDIPSLRRFCRS